MRLAVAILLLVPYSLAFSFRAAPVVRSRSSNSRYGTNSRHMTRVMCSSDQLPTLPPPLPEDDGSDGSKSNGQQSEGTSEAVIGNIMGPNRKITIAFTCNICEERNAYQINRVAYEEGIVVLWCKGCGQKHLIADNLGKMDFPEFGRNLEEYMAKKGTPVRRVTMSEDGISSFESKPLGVHLPSGEGPGPGGYDAKSILPGDNVGNSIIPGIPPAIFDFEKGQAAGASDSVSRGGRADDESTSQDSD